MATKVAINGFGRIGRNVLRALGLKASETARLLKSGLGAVRLELAGLEIRVLGRREPNVRLR